MAERMDATVAILTYNGEKYLGRILDALRGQEFPGRFEVLVVDSGSTDGTNAILDAHPEVRVHRIPNAEFGHGRTRNLAATMARGEFVVFLTHDAVPATPRWLAEMIAPFEIDERVAAVLGRQAPRAGCFPLMKYEIQGVFAQFGPDAGITLFRQGDLESQAGDRGILTFYSDVNSATRRAVLTGAVPYRDVPYAEDQMFGEDVIDAGLWKAYASRGVVEHSNDLTLREFGARVFDETVGLRRIGRTLPPLSRRGQLRLTVRGVLGDTQRILRDPGFSWRRRLYWLVVNPAYHLRKWAWYRRATRVDLADEASISAASLEHAMRSGSAQSASEKLG